MGKVGSQTRQDAPQACSSSWEVSVTLNPSAVPVWTHSDILTSPREVDLMSLWQVRKGKTHDIHRPRILKVWNYLLWPFVSPFLLSFPQTLQLHLNFIEHLLCIRQHVRHWGYSEDQRERQPLTYWSSQFYCSHKLCNYNDTNNHLITVTVMHLRKMTESNESGWWRNLTSLVCLEEEGAGRKGQIRPEEWVRVSQPRRGKCPGQREFLPNC